MAGEHTYVAGEIPGATTFNSYIRDQVITICTSGTRPTTTQEGRTIYETDTDRYYSWDGAAWIQALALGQWTAWTPVISQSGTIAATITYARYQKVGRMVTAQARVALTAGGTAANNVNWTLPVTPVTTADQCVGSWTHQSTSTGAWVTGSAIIGAGPLLFLAFSGESAGVFFGAAAPFGAAMVSGDKLSISVSYEATA